MNIKASSFDNILNQFQSWALQHPHKTMSRAFLPLISLVEGLIATDATYLDQKRRLFGPNFCCAGQVVLGDFETLSQALTSPQARTWRLGTSVLESAHAPNLDVGGRNLFLLSLSDQAAGGTGNHEAFRHCMQEYVLNDQAKIRQKDAIAQSLLTQLGEDYQTLYRDQEQSFFKNDQTGWMAFLVKYLHYVLLGLDPNNKSIISTLTDLHYTRKGTAYYLTGLGTIVDFVNRLKGGNLATLIEKAATIYEQSPALANFTQSDDYQGMTRRELAKLTTAIISIAALQGPLSLGYTAMGYLPLPAYTGQKTAEIAVTDYWDSLDLSDRPAIQRYLLECARLWAPVSATHRVATEPFSAEIAGKESQFPVGTPILIPMILGLLDEQFWGETTYEFNPERENLCPFHMAFHAVGDRSAGRICP
ncbi:MAG: cytochrome 450, partial [Microcystaceae cyanobacterium]